MSLKTPFKNAIETRVRTASGAGSTSGPEQSTLPGGSGDMGSPGGQRIVQYSGPVATPVQGLPSLKPEGRIFKIGR